MRLDELFTPDIPRIRDEIINMIQDAKIDQDWERMEHYMEVFKRTPYFDNDRQKQYISFTTDEKELNRAIQDALFSDDYFVRRLLKRMKGED